jgi:hypothetical protein
VPGCSGGVGEEAGEEGVLICVRDP